MQTSLYFLALSAHLPLSAFGGDDVAVLVETFDSGTQQDTLRSGAGLWGGGKLVPGPGGGSGRLGDLIVRSGETVVLSTDRQSFGPGALLDNYDPVTGMPGATGALVENGVFEFAYVDVDANATLIFEGERPARLFARGFLDIDGTVDVAGESLEDFFSMPCDVQISDPMDPDFCAELTPADFLGQAGGRGGPGGGDGGKGGDLPDADVTLQAVFGLDNPNAFIDLDGQDGEGVPVPNSFAPTDLVGGGGFGTHWPLNLPSNSNDLADLVIDTFLCFVRQAGAAGAGGAHATPGESGLNKNLGFIGSGGPTAPASVGGGAGAILANAQAATLDPDLGLLRGGAGGSGAGASVADTLFNGVFGACIDLTLPPLITDFRQSRGGGGGGGGGALQGQAGAFLSVSGQILANGGRGAGSGKVPSLVNDRLNDASPGGGGAGGGILLQAPGVQLSHFPGRLDVSGGPFAKGAENACRGGQGGSGFVRVESGLAPIPTLDFDAVAASVAPTAQELADYPAEPIPADILSVVNWEPEVSAPGTFSGAQSCWIAPDGQPGDVTFLADQGLTLGWNLTVLPSIPGVGPIPYRGRNSVLHGSLEEVLGSDLGAAPIVVRFQGARASAPLVDTCFVDVTDPVGPIVPGSLTPWVRHPSELNDLFGDPALAPNLIRFQIVFDRRDPLMQFIEGVTDLAILTQVN